MTDSNIEPFDDFRWTRNKIADALKMDRRRVSRALQDIEPAGSKNGFPTYRLHEAARVIFEVTANRPPEEMPPLDRRNWYEGERLRVGLEKEKATLVPLDDYRVELARVLKQVANTLETLPDVLERQHALPPAAILTTQAILDTVRTALADRLIAG